MSNPPATPPSKLKWGSRMGGVMRRASTVLAISRPGTPSEGTRDSDSVSLKRTTSRPDVSPQLPALSPPSIPAEAKLPTPIAESPAREAAATEEPPVGPSPLAQQTTSSAVEEAEPPAASAPKAEEGETTSPTGYIPPPVIDSTVGNPGAFTDDPESLPQPEIIARDPYAPPPAAEAEPTRTEPVSVGNLGAFSDEASLPQPETIARDPYAPPAAAEAEATLSEPTSGGNPGAFNDGLESLPQPEIIARDPNAPPPASGTKPLETAHEELREEVPAAPVQQEEHAPEAQKIEAPPVEATHSYFDKPIVESIIDFEEPDYEHGAAAEYYRGEPEMPVAEPTAAETYDRAQEEAHTNEDVPAPQPQDEVSTRPQDTQEASAELQPRAGDNNVYAPAPSMPTYDSLPAYMSLDEGHNVWGGNSSREAQPQPQSQPQEQPPSHLHEEEERIFTGVMPIPIPTTTNEGGEIISRAPSMMMPNPHPEVDYDDPFADPVPSIAVTEIHDNMHGNLPVSEQPPQMPVASHEGAPGAIIMPLPPFKEVIHPSSMNRAPSQSSMANGNGHSQNLPTDERMPLLSRPLTSSRRDHGYKSGANTSLYAPGGGGGTDTPANQASISPLGVASSSWDRINNRHHNYYSTSEQLKLHDLGWLEYHLPDGTIYYVHPTRKVTTDVNLRSETLLDAVEMWLDQRKGEDGEEEVSIGIEAWLRQVKPVGKNPAGGVQVQVPPAKNARSSKAKGGHQTFYFEKYWVDHFARTVLKDESDRYPSYTHPIGHSHGKGKKQVGTVVNIQEDKLDLEYRFWSFMEAYPAHLKLPAKTKLEAMDVLTWAWTDRLLPSERSIPSPFAQDECQELMNLLKSFEHDHRDDHGIQTRVVARILLRVAQWRQIYFRPNKPLPTDVSTHRLPLPPRRPFRRAFFDFFVSCLCLGIPYLFINRARLSGRVADEESGILRSATPLVVIGACTCLMAAIVLSASVTFLSLPGLDAVARTAGFVAVLFAAFTMVATGISVLSHKADVQRPVPHVGIEGFTVISRKSMALSLPLVLLAYSIIGFVTGIVLYSFRGSVNTGPPSAKHPFEEYTKWTVVGVVGALAGIMTMSMILFRR